MRFAGQMQSWGTRSRFDNRDTEVAPSKSGVLGLVAAALGRDRTETVVDLAALRLGVRIDREGVLLSDYHTAQDVIRADGGGRQATALSVRHYLADAVFLVGLESEERPILETIDQALENPHWPLALGRRSFPPSRPVQLRPPEDPTPIFEGPLREALSECPPLIETPAGPDVRYVVEDETGDQLWFDQPTSTFAERTFTMRKVRIVVAPWGEKWS